MCKNSFLDLKCNDDTIESIEKIFVISFYGTGEEPLFKNEYPNVLSLQVDDIKEPVDGYILFNEDHAKQVIDFLMNLKVTDDFTLIIQCYAGICRSGAVAEFARALFHLNSEEFIKDNPYIYPNSYMLSVIREYYHANHSRWAK
jgi:predicted protein tyrosine phosphatase